MPDGNHWSSLFGLSRSALLFSIFFVAAIVAVAAGAFKYGVKPADIAVLGFTAFSIIILAFAAAVLWQIGTGSIMLVGLIAEPTGPNDPPGSIGKASLSRFQFLIFTFVIAGLFLMLCIETGAFVEIPTNVLALLGISGGSFIISKAVGPQPADGQNGAGGQSTPNAVQAAANQQQAAANQRQAAANQQQAAANQAQTNADQAGQ